MEDRSGVIMKTKPKAEVKEKLQTLKKFLEEVLAM